MRLVIPFAAGGQYWSSQMTTSSFRVTGGAAAGIRRHRRRVRQPLSRTGGAETKLVSPYGHKLLYNTEAGLRLASHPPTLCIIIISPSG